jgi:ABC-type nitrate/sulfonate/bicarbonate transport system permease component
MLIYKLKKLLQGVLGWSLPVIIWIFLCYVVGVPQRYLPRPDAVFGAVSDIQPPLYLHITATAARVVIGTIAGTIGGVALALCITTWDSTRRLIMPAALSLRAIPPIATVPFFLLWFGFSEWGKFLLVATGVGLNIVVAAIQILEQTDEKFLIALTSFNRSLRSNPFVVSLPLIMEGLLPTLRTSVAIIFGASLVSELLGSQLGLGYLIQTSRTTYSMHVVFLVTLILGVLATFLDWGVVGVWNLFIFWRRKRAPSKEASAVRRLRSSEARRLRGS